MSKLFDQGDARVPEVFPRLAKRYATPGLPATWYPPSRRKAITGKSSPVTIRIVEMSMSGLMVEAPANKKIKIGLRFPLQFHGSEAIVEVCNLRPHDHPDRNNEQIFGVSFFRAEDEFELLIANIVHKLQEVNR